MQTSTHKTKERKEAHTRLMSSPRHASLSKKTLVFMVAPLLMTLLAATLAMAAESAGSSFPTEVKLREGCFSVRICTDDTPCISICGYLGYKSDGAKCMVDQGRYYCCCGPPKSSNELVH